MLTEIDVPPVPLWLQRGWVAGDDLGRSGGCVVPR